MEQDNNYIDLEVLVDTKGAKKYYRSLIRKNPDLSKKEIITKLQTKYELAREEARLLYKKFSN